MSRQQAKYTPNSIDVIYDDMEQISAGYTLKGSVSDFGSLPASPDNGDGWVTSDTGHLWVWDGAQWNDMGPFAGQQGPQGPQGPPGPPGDAGTASFVYEQGLPSAQWTVTHNLGFYPSVTVSDSAGSVVIPAINYLTINSVEILFSGATGGKAYFS